jgi:predicted nucleotidyltransferase component of viral defense system
MKATGKHKNLLLDLADQYARERGVPRETIAKELLHYEILQALILSGASDSLTFQGGTCLRLCYGNNRYSEDLDFAGGKGFDPASMQGFEDLLRTRVGRHYGLQLSIRERNNPGENVAMNRYAIKVALPQPNPALPQRQVINVEVAAVDAHRPQLANVAPQYEHLPTPLRSLSVVAEQPTEILSDKIVALGARPHLKQRDLWDLNFLADRGTELDHALTAQKVADYGLTMSAFISGLSQRIAQAQAPANHAAFHKEMSRFLDAPSARLLLRRGVTQALIDQALAPARAALERMQSAHSPGSLPSPPENGPESDPDGP